MNKAPNKAEHSFKGSATSPLPEAHNKMITIIGKNKQTRQFKEMSFYVFEVAREQFKEFKIIEDNILRVERFYNKEGVLETIFYPK